MNMCNLKTLHPQNPNLVTLVNDSNNEESVSDKHTFQIGDDVYEEGLPKPHIQYNTHPIKSRVF